MTFEEQELVHEYWSIDQRFGLRLNSTHIRSLMSACAKSYPNETGGILVGVYNQSLDCAEVSHVVFEPSDSRKGKTWFVRGVHGLQDKLNQFWLGQKGYYLGEWHFHPNGTPSPSPADIKQMVSIASSSKTHCPEPLLLIFSGKNVQKDIIFLPYVVRARNDLVELNKSQK